MSFVAKANCAAGGAYLAKIYAAPATYVVTFPLTIPSSTIAALVALGDWTANPILVFGIDGNNTGPVGDLTDTPKRWFAGFGSHPFGTVLADMPMLFVVQIVYDGSDVAISYTINGITSPDIDTFPVGASFEIEVGGVFPSDVAGEIYYLESVTITDGASTFSDDFSTGAFSPGWDSVVGDITVVAPPPTPPVPPASIPYQSPLWRFVVGDRATFEILSFLDRLASQRTVNYILNNPCVATCRVPSDNPEVNIPWPAAGDAPFLAEGTRVLWCFRRDGPDEAPWTIRAALMILQLEDAAQSDIAYSTVTAYDPWQYLMSLPVCNADGSLPGPNGISFTATRVDVIAATLLKNTIVNNGIVGIDAGATYGGTGFYTGTIDAPEAIDINFPQGTTVGQAWQQLCNGDYCDIILDPIYDPVNRPGYLVEFNIYSQVGSPKDDAIFAWDMPSRSLVGIDRLTDGRERANKVKFFAGQGGSAPGGQTIPVQTDAASVTKYGEYWQQTFLPWQTQTAVVQAFALAQLELAKNGKETVVFSPAPERSPIAFEDYFLGDRVPVYASNAFRAPIPSPDAPSSDENNYQRIYGIPITISDNATEQIQQMLTAIPAAGA